MACHPASAATARASRIGPRAAHRPFGFPALLAHRYSCLATPSAMLRPTPVLYRPRRPIRPRETDAAPPVVAHRIESVVHGGAPNALVVTIDGPLASVSPVASALSVVIGGTPRTPTGVNLSALPQVTLTFGVFVTPATTWTVPDATAWQFSDGATLEAPLSGTIT